MAISLAAMEQPGATNPRLSYYDVIADKIEADRALLDIPLANVKRWLAQGHSAPHRLEHRRALLGEAKAGDEGLSDCC